jgi:hypothetical protein
MRNGNGSSQSMSWGMRLGMAAAIGFGVFFVIWNMNTLRMSVEGVTVVWVPLVAFGAIWSAGDKRRATMGILLGTVVGIAGYYGAQVMTPLTPAGTGIGLGITAAVLAFVCLTARHAVSMATAMIGFGVAAGVSRLVGIRPSSGWGDIFEVGMACVVAMLIGAFAAHALRATVVYMRKEHPFEGVAQHMPEVHVPGVERIHLPHVHMPHLRRGNGSRHEEAGAGR